MIGVVRVIAGLLVSAAVAAPLSAGTAADASSLTRDEVSQSLVVTCKGLIHWPWCPRGK